MSVYKECPQDGGGGKSSAPSIGKHTSTSTSPNPGASSTTTHVSAKSQQALNHAGDDKAALAALLKTAGLRRHLASEGGTTTTPTAVGSAFDLSSGPTALLIVLAGTALLLVAGSGMRVWRTRRRV